MTSSVSPMTSYLNSMSNVSTPNGVNSYFSTGLGLSSNVNFKGTDDYNNYMSALQSDRKVSLTSQSGTRTGDKITKLANTLKNALYDGDTKLVKQTLAAIQNDPETIASVEVAYGKQEGSATALRDDIRKGLNNWSTEWPVLSHVCNFFRSTVGQLWGNDTISERDAIDILNRGAEASTQVAANALKNALKQGVIFKDRKTINGILEKYSGRMNEIMNLYDGDLVSDIKSQYVWLIDGPTTENKVVNKVTAGLYA